MRKCLHGSSSHNRQAIAQNEKEAPGGPCARKGVLASVRLIRFELAGQGEQLDDPGRAVTDCGSHNRGAVSPNCCVKVP